LKRAEPSLFFIGIDPKTFAGVNEFELVCANAPATNARSGGRQDGDVLTMPAPIARDQEELTIRAGGQILAGWQQVRVTRCVAKGAIRENQHITIERL
jgi:hypothetical protein